MPDQSANLAGYRAGRHQIGVKLSIYKGAVLASGDITATPTFPVTDLAVSYSVSSSAVVIRGMLVKIRTSGGALKGITRVRYSGTISASNLPIRENSDAKISIVSGDTFELLEEIRLGDKLVTATDTFDPDGESYSDFGSAPRPVVCSGGHRAGKVDSGQTYMTVSTNGAFTWTTDSANVSGFDHLWTLPTGIAFAPGSADTDVSPILRVDPGSYLVVHQVTDADSSKVTTQYINYICDDGSNTWDILEASVEGSEQGLSSAYSRASVKLRSVVSLDDMPDGSLAILWAEDETIGGSAVLYRNWNAICPSILFVGYIRRDTTENNTDSGDTMSLDIISPMERLGEIVSYSKGMIEDASPDEWAKHLGVTVFNAETWLAQIYTNLTEAGFDWVQLGAPADKVYPALYLQKSNFLGQMVELSNGIRARVVCDRTGRFTTAWHPALIPLASRAAVDATDSYTDVDVKPGYTIGRQQWEPTEFTRLRGFTSGSDPQPIATVYPGGAPGMGTDNTTVERQIVDDVEDAKEAVGMFGAHNDGVYVDADGARQFAPTVDATLPGAYDHFDFGLEYQQLDLDTARTSTTDLNLTDFLFYVKRWRASYKSDGSAEVGVQWGAATCAPPGEQDDIQTNVLPPVTEPITTPITTPTFPTLPNGAQQLMAALTPVGLYRARNFQSASPIYDSQAWGSFGTAVTGTFLLWVPDGYAPGSGWVFTTTKIYSLNIDTRTTTLLHTWSSTLQSVSADASWGAAPGFVLAIGYIAGVGSTAAYATDGATFTEVAITTAYATDGAGFGVRNGCYVSWRTAGKAFTSVYTGTGTINPATVTVAGKSTGDYGATWGTPSSPTITTGATLAATIHLPVHDNASESIAYYTNIPTASIPGDQRLYKAIGASVSDVSPVIGGESCAPRTARDGIASYVGNRLRMMAVVQRETSGDYAVVLSNDGAASWATIIAAGSNARRCALSGDNPDRGWTFGVSQYLTQLTISGSSVTVQDKSGNLGTLSAGEVIAIAGWNG